jgi:hypothetical protein
MNRPLWNTQTYFPGAALADRELGLENPGQVLVNQQSVLNEDLAFKTTQ